jgi:hypothetical protein
MTAPIDDPVAIEAMFKRAEDEDAFWDAHYDELKARYPDEFVAVSVRDREVVEHDPDLIAITDRLRARGYSHLDVWVKFTFTKYPNYAL